MPKDFSGFANPTRYQIANWTHHNVPYAEPHGAPEGAGAADNSYATEWGSEVINFYLSGAADHSGNRFTKDLMGTLSTTYGTITEIRQKAGGNYNPTVAESIAACKDRTSSVNRVLFNDGSEVSVRFGGGNTKYYVRAGDAGFPRHAALGGYFHWADPTPEKYNLKQWMRRGKYIDSDAWRADAAALVTNPTRPTGSNNGSWEWVACLLMTSLLDPDTDLTRLDLRW